MEKLLLKILALSALTVSACAPEKKTENTGIDSYTVVSGTLAENRVENIAGVGTIRFRHTLSGVHSSQVYGLQGSLDGNNATLTVISHAASVLLTDGIHVRFVRNGDTVQTEIEVNGGGLRTVSQVRIRELYPTELNVTVQIQNVNGKPARVVLWKEQRTTLAYAEALVDSDVAGHLDQGMAAALGEGVFYGLKLANSTVTTLRLKEDK